MNSTTTPAKLYRMSMPDHECPWGLKAVALLNEKGIAFEDIKLTSREAVDAFKAQYNVATTPQIFFGGERIGIVGDIGRVDPLYAPSLDREVVQVFFRLGDKGLGI